MNGDMLISEWIKLHWGITIPDFNFLGGAGYGVPNLFAHIILYMIISGLIAKFVFWLYFFIREHTGVYKQ